MFPTHTDRFPRRPHKMTLTRGIIQHHKLAHRARLQELSYSALNKTKWNNKITEASDSNGHRDRS